MNVNPNAAPGGCRIIKSAVTAYDDKYELVDFERSREVLKNTTKGKVYEWYSELSDGAGDFGINKIVNGTNYFVKPTSEQCTCIKADKSPMECNATETTTSTLSEGSTSIASSWAYWRDWFGLHSIAGIVGVTLTLLLVVMVIRRVYIWRKKISLQRRHTRKNISERALPFAPPTSEVRPPPLYSPHVVDMGHQETSAIGYYGSAIPDPNDSHLITCQPGYMPMYPLTHRD